MSVTEITPSRVFGAARKITKALIPSENSIDGSIVGTVRLIESIVSGRLETGVAAEVGHDAFLSATATLMALSDARSHVIQCHRQLTTVRDTQGMTGDGLGCTVTKNPRSELNPAVAA